MPPNIDIQNASRDVTIPLEADMERWILAALETSPDSTEISVRIVDEQESRELNQRYRGVDKSTNVLSFPAELPEGIDWPLLGDLAICAPVVRREALEQDKTPDAHWAHMLVHGTLHLLGYDHIDDAEAEQMENLETRILGRLGFPPPYEAEPGQQTGNRS